MKLRKEEVYYTRDGTLFTGKNALKDAEKYQREYDFGKNAKKLVPEARKIMDLPEAIEVNGFGSKILTTEELRVIERLQYCIDYDYDEGDMETFEEIFDHFVDMYIDAPEIVKLFNFIDKKFKKG
ncbi:MAG: hypothetical protein JJV94_07205 [Sulfurospirillum sp.]|nr:hypothetical protein [Sulfurospirillum sp.]